MAEKSGFFDARYVNGVYDRVYNADSFADYFSSFISNGVFAGKEQELLVTQTSPAATMAVTVQPGRAYIKGYWYKLDAPKNLYLLNATSNPRIDSIVAELDLFYRRIEIKVLRGTELNVPVPPTISDEQIQLAQVLVSPGSSAIINSKITDTRWDKDVCGAVGAIVNQIDTEAFHNQVNELCQYYYGLAENSYNTYVEQLQDLIRVMEETIIDGDLSAVMVELSNKLDAPYKNIPNGLIYQDVNDDVYLVSPNGFGGEVSFPLTVDLFVDNTLVIQPQWISLPVYRRWQKVLVIAEFELDVLLQNENSFATIDLPVEVYAASGVSASFRRFMQFVWPQGQGVGDTVKISQTFCFSFTKVTPGTQQIGVFSGGLRFISGCSISDLRCTPKFILLNHDDDIANALFTSDNKMVVSSDSKYISPKG